MLSVGGAPYLPLFTDNGVRVEILNLLKSRTRFRSRAAPLRAMGAGTQSLDCLKTSNASMLAADAADRASLNSRP